MKTAPLSLLVLATAILGASPLTTRAAVDLPAKVAQIDKLVAVNLAKQKQQPNAPASDEIFVRRVYLDIVGRIPTIKETTDFLADKAADKRAKLIDALLDSDGYAQNFFNYWADILRARSQLTQGNSQPAGAAAAVESSKVHSSSFVEALD